MNEKAIDCLNAPVWLAMNATAAEFSETRRRINRVAASHGSESYIQQPTWVDSRIVEGH